MVEVAVGGAQTGDDVSIDVSPPSVEDDEVAFDGISVTVKRDGDFTMRVTNSQEALPGSPEFEPEEAADPLGRIRLEHSITNEEIEDVSFDFRVSKERLRSTGTDPETVALYRYADGTWTELPTDVVGETETHYLLWADSSGMSEFAIGAKRPRFETWWASVDDTSIAAGGSTTVSGRVTNVGGADGIFDAELLVDGRVVDERRITVAAGGTRQVNFEATFERPGTYEVAINEAPAGSVSVDARDGGPSAANVELIDASLELALDLGRIFGIVPPSLA